MNRLWLSVLTCLSCRQRCAGYDVVLEEVGGHPGALSMALRGMYGRGYITENGRGWLITESGRAALAVAQEAQEPQGQMALF